MAGGKAVIEVVPTPGEPFQFDLKADKSIPLTGETIDSVSWFVPIPGYPPVAGSALTLHNEFDYLSPNFHEYTAQLVVRFSDGSVDTTLKKFGVPHGIEL